MDARTAEEIPQQHSGHVAVLALGMIPLALLLRHVDLDVGGKASAMH
jgi:hypothetical protein